MPSGWMNMRMVSGVHGVSTSTSAMAKCWPWNPPSSFVPASVRVVLWPPSAPTTQPTRVVSSPSWERRVTSTPSASWANAVSVTPRSTTMPSSPARSARTASVSGWGMSRTYGWRLGIPATAEAGTGAARAAVEHIEGADPPAACLQPGQDSQGGEHLHAARVDAHRPRLGGRLIEGVDDAYGHAEAGQLAGGREPHRPGPDHQHAVRLRPVRGLGRPVVRRVHTSSPILDGASARPSRSRHSLQVGSNPRYGLERARGPVRPISRPGRRSPARCARPTRRWTT